MRVDKYDTETWRRYRIGLCKDCRAHCCTLPVTATSEDLFHMGYITYDEVNGPLDAICARLKREGIVRSLNRRTRIFTLARRKNGDCIFLNSERRCDIYERRPFICREFPRNSARPHYCPYEMKK